MQKFLLTFALIGAFAPPAMAFSFTQPREERGFVAVNFPYCYENPWDKKCRDGNAAQRKAAERAKS
jgi:hypothetical protein